ncbi:MAG TPA: hypothetical protein PLV68_10085, partial [Ilumatobacteraceae bacterium]|nr:hypothetical protein [Ilumatobacteraceae bacterium]
MAVLWRAMGDDGVLVLRAGRDKSVRRRHPWVLSGSVERVEGDPAPGATVRVVSADGEMLGRAAYSPASRLRARMWTFDDATTVDAELIAARVTTAAARRARLLHDTDTDAVRLVFSEADDLAGVIADRYGSTVVLQLGSAGADRWRGEITDALAALPGVDSVFERSDLDARQREGLTARTGLLAGPMPTDELIIHEGP